MALEHITLKNCIKLYEKYGWMAVIRDGRVVDFEKKKGHAWYETKARQ